MLELCEMYLLRIVGTLIVLGIVQYFQMLIWSTWSYCLDSSIRVFSVGKLSS